MKDAYTIQQIGEFVGYFTAVIVVAGGVVWRFLPMLSKRIHHSVQEEQEAQGFRDGWFIAHFAEWKKHVDSSIENLRETDNDMKLRLQKVEDHQAFQSETLKRLDDGQTEITKIMRAVAREVNILVGESGRQGIKGGHGK